jgi:glycine cleavage system H lipoate-binding protein
MEDIMTELQKRMIIKIATDDYTPINGAVPTCREDAETWLEMIVETPEDKGVFVSLKNAGMIWNDGGGKEAVIGLTDKGFEALSLFAQEVK